MWPKTAWKRIPHLMQQPETPRKGYKINNVDHFTIIRTICYDKSLIKKWMSTKTERPRMT